MTFDAIVALLTTILSVIVKIVGFPDQIRSNYAHKSTTGLSGWFVVSAFLSYVMWTVHGFLAHDRSLIIGQGLGVLTSGVIVGQIFLYRGAGKRTKLSRSAWLLLPGLAKHGQRTIGSLMRRNRTPPDGSPPRR
jgi:uncharacterized protein with PQ loop repeat